MPSSPPFHITAMLEHVLKVQPTSVIDIGVGFGKWGVLCRDTLDILEERYTKEDWKVRIDGIEAFPEYANPMYEYIYNNIYYGDALEVVDKIGEYDLAILGDVIEHFTKDVGQNLLNKLSKKCKFILISSPTKFFEQHLFNNPFEEHKSLWGLDDFKDYTFDYDEVLDYTFIALLDCKKTGKIKRRQKVSSKLVYSMKSMRSHPKLATLVKAGLIKLIPT